MGDIEESLFSVVAQKQSPQDRFENVGRLATRVTEILDYLKTVCKPRPCYLYMHVTQHIPGMSRGSDVGCDQD